MMITPPPEPPLRQDSSLTTWGYLWSFLLLSLPLAGLVIAIVWASGGAQNRSRVYMARAWLLLAGAVALLALGAVVGASWQAWVMWG